MDGGGLKCLPQSPTKYTGAKDPIKQQSYTGKAKAPSAIVFLLTVCLQDYFSISSLALKKKCY